MSGGRFHASRFTESWPFIYLSIYFRSTPTAPLGCLFTATSFHSFLFLDFLTWWSLNEWLNWGNEMDLIRLWVCVCFLKQMCTTNVTACMDVAGVGTFHVSSWRMALRKPKAAAAAAAASVEFMLQSGFFSTWLTDWTCTRSDVTNRIFRVLATLKNIYKNEIRFL